MTFEGRSADVFTAPSKQSSVQLTMRVFGLMPWPGLPPPLEDFISRRDELAKQLRTDKRRDDAALVKALRKPSRIAWTLDAVVHEDAASIDRLAAAIGEAQTGGDLRTALEAVKEAVRAV